MLKRLTPFWFRLRRLRDLRVAEVVEQDLAIENGKVVAYRTKVKVSFKYEGKE